MSETTSATVASATRSRSSSAAPGSSPAPSSSAPRELVGDAGRAQVRARVAAEPRVHDRRVGQRAVGARAVVVGDHDVHAGRLRRRDLGDGGDRAVDGDQQVGPARGEPLDRRGGEAVAVVDAARQVPVDVGAERPQGADEDRGRADAVHVVVAVDGDPRAARDVAEDHPGAVAEAAEGVERVRVLGGEEALRRDRVAQPAAHQHLREHVRDPQLAAEVLGGGEVVGGDLEAGVLAAHGPDARAAGGRNGRAPEIGCRPDARPAHRRRRRRHGDHGSALPAHPSIRRDPARSARGAARAALRARAARRGPARGLDARRGPRRTRRRVHPPARGGAHVAGVSPCRRPQPDRRPDRRLPRRARGLGRARAGRRGRARKPRLRCLGGRRGSTRPRCRRRRREPPRRPRRSWCRPGRGP